ncbi:hypothetical protein [Sphingobacterium sp. LRF_L2]|uniref:hypothetical protein n=1 Tax=Sphingobacterium sp. LRF_L2 TaxID=3369421 RepID=UPI003F62AC60
MTFFFACKKNDEAKAYGSGEQGKYAVWARIGNYPNSSTFVVDIASLDTGTLNYIKSGVEVDEKLHYGLVAKDGYYYETLGKGRFGKYRVKDSRLQVVQEVPFTHLSTEYAHTWQDDRLLLVGTSGDNKKVLYASMDTIQLRMTLGEITLPTIPEGFDTYAIGFLQYRPSDKKIFLGFNYKLSSDWTKNDGQVNVAVINSESFVTEQVLTDRRANSSGNNNLFQMYSFLDKNENIYFSAGGFQTTGDNSMLLRIKKEDTQIDDTYSNFSDNAYFISGIWDLRNGKAIIRYRNSELSGNHVYAFGLLDLETRALSALEVPACSSGSIQSVIVESDRAYILTNHEGNEDGYIYTYMISSGQLQKGMRIPLGYTWLLRIDKMY